MHNKTMVAALLAVASLFSGAAHSGGKIGQPPAPPARLVVSCSDSGLMNPGGGSLWICRACEGSFCSPSWIADHDMSGNYP